MGGRWYLPLAIFPVLIASVMLLLSVVVSPERWRSMYFIEGDKWAEDGRPLARRACSFVGQGRCRLPFIQWRRTGEY